MKKNISINISGIIFHIEEDGYDTLKKYLDSINKYFSTFEDSNEILADIESRIAEIFLSKLNEEKQVITLEDVNTLVATMGSVSDFRAVEDEEQAHTGSSQQRTTAEDPTPGAQPSYTRPKQLMRDQKRKILGGVCAGLANYLNVDALWIRLIFALLTFVYGITFFIYVIMWIIVPGSFELDEPIVGKKMYRDPEHKVLGGVAGGVAAYLGIELLAVRVLFIIFTFVGGLGVFLYIVLWLILPEARTLTEQIQMQGGPVTLSNIESTIKKNQTERIAEDETALTKILLFPFRLLAVVVNALARVLGPLAEVIRVAIGIIIVLTGISLVFGIIVSAGILFGIITSSALALPWMDGVNESRVPVDAFVRAFPVWTGVAAFFTTIVPAIFVILLGVSVIAKRIVFGAAAGWSLFVIFFVSVAILAVSIPKIVFSFKEEASYTVENTYRIPGKKAILKINETGMDDYNAVKLELEGYEGNELRLIQKFEAQGASRQQAIENAKMVNYQVNVRDSIITFDSNLQFKDDAIFRAQRIKMTLMIPYNYPFTMDEGISRMITQYVDWEYMDNYTWNMTPEGLKCLSCPKDKDENITTDLSDFNQIEISGKFDLRVVNGGEYKVQLSGSDDAKDKYSIRKVGETLVIDFEGKKKFDWKVKDINLEEVEITVTMPDLESLEATGVGEIRLDEFNTEELDIEMRGPVKLRGEIHVRDLNLNLTGSSEADLSGRADNLNARIEFASTLRAYSLESIDAFVETSGGSSAKVNVQNNLEMEEGIASKIEYRGSPNVTKRD